ncbi:hypothetical protein GTA08_BOTSDO00415 [Botryosphaeria dothidea]|uniref:CFEM domain-containing protein n=1 Tax=Botryosphaeria dothidea TaxID=55169 RepID=A0A8H4J6S1_9PEZI|nr:hypothetical protein GTA08_BOTSDO00415 [Botryosphaeria dothidea]
MKFSTAVVLAASASMAAAYTTADIPTCAVPCIKAGAPKVGCEVTDAACQCKKQDDLAAEVIGCISEKCTAEEAVKSSTVSDSICQDLNSGKSTTSGSSSSNSSTSAVSTPVSTPASSSPTPSSTNAAGVLQAGGYAAGLSAMMGAIMLAL